jgi:hypothetical protein
MWNISVPARRTFLVISAFAHYSLPMYGQTVNAGAITGGVSHSSNDISIPLPATISIPLL